ncbi:MAG: S8 family serine peptidase, partial [Microscillaceae bacterium]|nr:S8 family serine peptidase [Microscillaceae bacterium]
MLEQFYPYAVIGLCLSIVWVFFQLYKQRSTLLPSLSFWAASLTYAITVFMTDFSFYHKLLLMLPRDLVVFVMVFLLANNLKNTRAFFLAAVGIGLAGYLIYSRFVPEAWQKVFGPSQESIPAAQLPSELARNGELLLDLKVNTQPEALVVLLQNYQVSLKRAFPDLKYPDLTDLDEYYTLDVPDAQIKNLAKIITAIQASGLTDVVEYNEVIRLSLPVPSPSRPAPPPIDYGLDDPNLAQLWGFEKMQMADYFQYLRQEEISPKKRAKIAILDTGVEGRHEDLKDNYVSTRSQYDQDKQSHGTHCAGIAAAVSNNGRGGASLALNPGFLQVTSIKVLSDFGWGTQQDIINGMIEAADQGADVISMSLGGPSRDNAQKAYEAAIRYANRAGAVVVVAAGNDNRNAKNYVPAACEGVIVVAALSPDLKKASFSNFISDLGMGIAAPGQDILSTIPGNKYAAYSGTSMATPYVAGLVGVLKALRSDLNTAQVYALLKDTGLDTPDSP